jgi:hypothetical protein
MRLRQFLAKERAGADTTIHSARPPRLPGVGVDEDAIAAWLCVARQIAAACRKAAE